MFSKICLAYGVLWIGDRIIKANGELFTTPHKFGYDMEKIGNDRLR